MDPEFVELAREAVAALQVASQPTWVEITELVIYSSGLTVIGWQLWQMQKAGWERDREIDAMAGRLREVGYRMEQAGRELAETARRRVGRQRRTPLPSN